MSAEERLCPAVLAFALNVQAAGTFRTGGSFFYFGSPENFCFSGCHFFEEV